MKKKLITIITASALLSIPICIASATISSSNVYAAESSVADDTSTRSITLTKYQATDLNDHDLPGDGTETAPNKEILQNVQFKLQRVIAEPGHALTDAATDQLNVDYKVDPTFTEQILTTGVDGKITWNLGTGKSNDGIYLVTEVDSSNAMDSNGKRVDVKVNSNPFFVQVPMTNRQTQSGLIYNVVVEPKNVISNDINPEKTINGKMGDSVIAGQPFQWELTTGVPTGLYETALVDSAVPMLDRNGNQLYDPSGNKVTKVFKAGEFIYMEPDVDAVYYDENKNIVDAANVVSVSNFTITDTLDNNLMYQSSTLWAYAKGSTTPVELPTSYYTISNPKDNNNVFKMMLTKEGIMAIGTNKVVDKDGNNIGEIEKISVHMTTVVAEGFNGLISNTFDTTYQTPGGKPIKPNPPVTPKEFNGGFDIIKVDKADQTTLAGAVFHISVTEADAKAGKFLATDGNSYTIDEATSQNKTLLSSTSDASGRATFDGLPLIWNDSNNNGEVDLTDSIQKSYWVVETTAPDGYELLKSAKEVVVDLNTAEDSIVEFTAEDVKKTNLPFTGGVGTVLMITIAIGTIGIGTAIIVINKRRNSMNV